MTITATFDALGWRYLRLIPVDDVLAPLQRLFVALALLLSLSVVTTATLLIVASNRNIISPLQQPVAVVTRQGEGQTGLRVYVPGSGEIDRLGLAFNDMAAKLEHRTNELQRTLEQQRELNRLKDEFIQNVSHELRTPLTVVRGYAELLDNGELGELSPRQREPIHAIVQREVMLTKVLDDLLTILAAESHKIAHEPMDFGELIEGWVADHDAMGERADLTFTTEITAEPISVVGDPVSLQQMLDNLLSNATKYTPAGGWVYMRVNSPSDVDFDARSTASGDLFCTATVVAANFGAANTVVNGINPSPNPAILNLSEESVRPRGFGHKPATGYT